MLCSHFCSTKDHVHVHTCCRPLGSSPLRPPSGSEAASPGCVPHFTNSVITVLGILILCLRVVGGCWGVNAGWACAGVNKVGNFFFSQIISYGALIQVQIPLNPCVFELGRGSTSKLAKVLMARREHTAKRGRHLSETLERLGGLGESNPGPPGRFRRRSQNRWTIGNCTDTRTD